MLRVAPPRKTRQPDHIRVNWPVDASASGLAQVGPGGRHRWAARVQVGQEPARQKAREGYPSHYTSLLRPRQNGRHFSDIFNCISLNENISIAITISLKFVPKGPINDIAVLVQIMVWRCPGTKPLSEPMMVSLPTHICVTRPQWDKQQDYICFAAINQIVSADSWILRCHLMVKNSHYEHKTVSLMTIVSWLCECWKDNLWFPDRHTHI